jgi:hypothetical protein
VERGRQNWTRLTQTNLERPQIHGTAQHFSIRNFCFCKLTLRNSHTRKSDLYDKWVYGLCLLSTITIRILVQYWKLGPFWSLGERWGFTYLAGPDSKSCVSQQVSDPTEQVLPCTWGWNQSPFQHIVFCLEHLKVENVQKPSNPKYNMLPYECLKLMIFFFVMYLMKLCIHYSLYGKCILLIAVIYFAGSTSNSVFIHY